MRVSKAWRSKRVTPTIPTTIFSAQRTVRVKTLTLVISSWRGRWTRTTTILLTRFITKTSSYLLCNLNSSQSSQFSNLKPYPHNSVSVLTFPNFYVGSVFAHRPRTLKIRNFNSISEILKAQIKKSHKPKNNSIRCNLIKNSSDWIN